ncbi:hypothetical protein [Ehrlichia canis]|uniref:Uncharacterized protein n=1 Tax=Ehrlichia canis (strain Jake) TaxID=269484 RepID=A0ACA6AWB2_EHRCJ|nr:hypothetical protein [Ehrlichia canis]AAZ68516.1 hypothetical protein Ecaj_0479 [Ehrlichia canis str. Jake]AUO54741.1 hypothetical protein C1I72_02430 [Ehrlichia canis]UKC53605.1 hypothetical protein s20019040002_000648 [Ehrlichia canis]UKC54543.1 hypothetical protein s20026770001_000649 [Ehrlichia canis]UKC55479.1 hypothetical protein s21009500007_000649 [Ehrlichia canis]
MELILLFEGNVPVLYPASVCTYNKLQDSYTISYPTLDISTTVQRPGSDVPLYRLYGSKFNSYCIVSNTSLPRIMYYLYGTTRGGGEDSPFLIFGLKHNSLSRLGEEGVVLDDEVLLNGGFLRDSGTVEENTVQLFERFRRFMKLESDVGTPRTYRFDFFNSGGDLFHTDYRSTQLEQVAVNPVTGNNRYIMHF